MGRLSGWGLDKWVEDGRWRIEDGERLLEQRPLHAILYPPSSILDSFGVVKCRREFRQSTSSLTAITVLDSFTQAEKSKPDLSTVFDHFQ